MAETKPKSTRRHPRVQTHFTGRSKTKQQFKNETNINNLVNAYLKTGELKHLNPKPPVYGYATSNDFLTSLVIVDDAKQMFAALPAALRSRFENDPAAFLAFAQDSDNHLEMAELGLLSDEATAELLPGDPEPSEAPAEPTPDPDKPE